ncbi:hypothetical protein [Emcibacter sp. SYSU 3D8]|uniref:hypothetical protein n=1 Tax=Emcibacter sp. SYSU 3D8 TaxID=3133969 RepID=UPI0031FE5433
MTEIGRLITTPPRQAWPHEAIDFTPWLAANLDHLSEVIGIPLELEGQEVAVESFSADILARNLADNSRVLIENQLEATNHTHLGQIMTYLVGLEAKTIVWIATDFREPHLSAIKWLNEHTADPFAFFAIRLRVVRIGDSPLAPIFEVLEKPNQWERRLQAVAQENRGVSAVGEFRQRYWTAYRERYPEDVERRAPRGGSAWWWYIGDKDLILSIYLSKKGVGIFVRGHGSDAVETYRRLADHAAPLSERLGAPIGGEGDTYLFQSTHDADMENEANWPAAMEWMHTEARRYDAAVREILGISG